MERAGGVLRLALSRLDPGPVMQPVAALVHALGVAGDVGSTWGFSPKRPVGELGPWALCTGGLVHQAHPT